MEFIGCIYILIFIVFALIKYNKNGYLIFLDSSTLTLSLWLLVIGLYDLGLSKLIHPTLAVNIICSLVVFMFAIAELYNKRCIKYLKLNFLNIIDNKVPKVYDNLIFVLYLLGVIAFLLTFDKNGFTLLNDNKISRTELVFGYFYYFLILSFLYGFYNIYMVKYRQKGILYYYFLMASSLVMHLVLLNRGIILFALTGMCVCFFVKRYNKYRNAFFKKRNIFCFFSVFLAFVYVFGYVGDLRFEVVGRLVYKMTLTEFYGFPQWVPSGVAQLYIYAVSPLENFAYSLENQEVYTYTIFLRLFYPFFKFIANLCGAGVDFTQFLQNAGGMQPYLWDIAGLNVMSFMADAVQDFDVPGIYMYVCFYVLIMKFCNYIIKKNMFTFSKIAILTMLYQVFIWSPFINSIFALATLWTNVCAIMFIDWFTRKVKL